MFLRITDCNFHLELTEINLNSSNLLRLGTLPDLVDLDSTGTLGLNGIDSGRIGWAKLHLGCDPHYYIHCYTCLFLGYLILYKTKMV